MTTSWKINLDNMPEQEPYSYYYKPGDNQVGSAPSIYAGTGGYADPAYQKIDLAQAQGYLNANPTLSERAKSLNAQLLQSAFPSNYVVPDLAGKAIDLNKGGGYYFRIGGQQYAISPQEAQSLISQGINPFLIDTNSIAGSVGGAPQTAQQIIDSINQMTTPTVGGLTRDQILSGQIPQSGYIKSAVSPLTGETQTNIPVDKYQQQVAEAQQGFVPVPTQGGGTAYASPAQAAAVQAAQQAPQQQPQAPTSGTPTTQTMANVGGTPSLSEGTTYTVKPGDTLGAIAKQLGVPPTSITGYRSGNPNLIYPGEVLQISGTNQSSMQGGGGTAPTGNNASNANLGASTGLITDTNTQNTSQITQKTPSDFIQTYNQTLKDMGVSTIKEKYESVQKEFDDLNKELSDKIADINDNPWYSEGVRIGRINKLKEKYDLKLNTLSNKMKLLDSLYQEGVATAKFLTTGEIGQQEKAFELAQKSLDAQTALSKDQRSTVNNLIQTYPDAGISPTDDIVTASTKASNSPSFIGKNSGTLRAIVDPATGQVTYYYSKQPGTTGTTGGGTPTTGGGVGTGSGTGAGTGGTTTSTPSFIQSALESYPGGSYIDLSKISGQAQIVAAQNYATKNNVPLLSKEDANAIQTDYKKYLAASSVINQIATLTKDVITANNNVFDKTAQLIKLKAAEIAPSSTTDTKAIQFIAARNSVLSLLSRASGEVGVLTDSDRAVIANALPAYSDDKDTAQQKALNLDYLIRSAFDASVKAYITNNGIAPTGSSGQTSDGIGFKVIP